MAAAWLLAGAPHAARAYGPQGFRTVVIDPGHGGFDRGGGPGQRIAESTYTLDTSLRLQRALRARGFRTVMTRTDDTFIPLGTRVAIANSFRDAIFVSVHYNSGARVGAHGYETYYYRSDSYGLAARLHSAQLATLNTEDRRLRRRGFFVVRRTAIPSVLCEGGFLTNPEEARIILSSAYRERWAGNVADAIAQQSRYGNPDNMGYQPPVTSERTVSRRSSGGGRSSSVRHRQHGGSRRSTVRSRGGSRRSSVRSKSGKSRRTGTTRHRRRR